jgi:hypothetical protein
LIQFLPLLQLPGDEAGTAAVLNLAVGAFSLVLFALSLTAYRKTRLRRLVLVAAAFAFFALSVAVRNLEIFLLPGLDVDEVLVTALELVALLCFFVALVVRE